MTSWKHNHLTLRSVACHWIKKRNCCLITTIAFLVSLDILKAIQLINESLTKRISCEFAKKNGIIRKLIATYYPTVNFAREFYLGIAVGKLHLGTRSLGARRANRQFVGAISRIFCFLDTESVC